MLFLLKYHSKVLLFCFVVFIFGNLGQTYLISWWNPHIEEVYGISRTLLGFIYAAATFLSSFFLPTLGRGVDRFPPLSFGLMISTGLTVGFVVFSIAWEVFGLFLGYFIIRLCGQMGLTLLATTTISRKFGKHRGKALALAQLGRPLGEAFFPMVVVWLLARGSCQQAALVVGLGFLALFFPFCLGFARSLNYRPLYQESENIAKLKSSENKITQNFSSKQFYQDKHTILVMAANTLIPFVMTGLFFQQTAFAQIKDWNAVTMGQAFTLYGLMGLVCVFVSGFLIDRFSATRMLPLPLIPLALSFAILLWGEGRLACFAYVGLLGISTGLASNLRSSFYAENFPLHHLGSIKGLDAGHLVRATALSPLIFSYALDRQIPLGLMIATLAAITALGLTFYLKASLHYSAERTQRS